MEFHLPISAGIIQFAGGATFRVKKLVNILDSHSKSRRFINGLCFPAKWHGKCDKPGMDITASKINEWVQVDRRRKIRAQAAAGSLAVSGRFSFIFSQRQSWCFLLKPSHGDSEPRLRKARPHREKFPRFRRTPAKRDQLREAGGSDHEVSSAVRFKPTARPRCIAPFVQSPRSAPR